MMDAIEARLLLIDCFDYPPWSFQNVGSLEHELLGPGVLFPAAAGFQIHRTELPLLEGIMNARQEAVVLLFIGDRKPVLDQDDAGADQHPLKFGNTTEEFFTFVTGAKPHDLFHPRTVVPATVEQHDLATR